MIRVNAANGEVLIVDDANDKLFEAAGECALSEFENCKGESFVFKPLDAPDVKYQLRLVEITQHPAQPNQGSEPKRVPFSLFFEPVLQQTPPISGLHTVFKDSEAWMIIFVSPVVKQSAGGSSFVFESVFT